VALLAADRAPSRLQAFWAYARDVDPATLPGDQVAAYTQLMAASQAFVADDILDAFPLQGMKRLMDLGGGDGSFLISAARRWPELDLTLVDLPAVAARADARFAAAGLAARASAVGCDVRRDALPRGADVISLVRVVHDHDDAAVAAILRAAFEALPSGGRVLIAEPMAEARGAERVGAAYFNFYLRAMGSGRARTADELQDALIAAGFSDVARVPTRRPMLTGAVAGRRQ
jgi:demethylspheroidene O-methyltransferase